MVGNIGNRMLETSCLDMVGNGEKERRHEVGDDRWRPHVSEGGKSSDDTGSCMPVKKPPHKPILIIRGQIYPVC